MESDTPRTDALVDEGGMPYDADFARKLERELASAKAEVAALKAERDPLSEMWAALEAYQPMADRDGHGESWRVMCAERTAAAAWAAVAAARAAAAAWAEAIAAIRRAREEER